MSFQVIHLVSSLRKINFGIWNAAITGASVLQQHFRLQSKLWVCASSKDAMSSGLTERFLGDKFLPDSELDRTINDEQLASDTIFVSHGAWLQPTRYGAKLQSRGFKWIYAPHGMFEPWSMQNGKLKKAFYYNLIEKKLAANCDGIRAVSPAEKHNLEKRFDQKIFLVENGVAMPPPEEKQNASMIFLFMARLHHKKGVLPLVEAWHDVMKNHDCKLIIAGPDEGELAKIQPYLSANVEYLGPVYGAKKTELLAQAHYYMLPSFSEGFPTSVLEAMSYGCIPVISRGCNFPDVFSNGLGYEVTPDAAHIANVLRSLLFKPFDYGLSRKNVDFVAANYSEEIIARKLHAMYIEVLNL